MQGDQVYQYQVKACACLAKQPTLAYPPISLAQVHCRTMLASNLVLHLPLTIIRATSAQVHERAPPAAIAGWCAMQVSLD